jgi:hypothetical protein
MASDRRPTESVTKKAETFRAMVSKAADIDSHAYFFRDLLSSISQIA